MPWTMVFRFKTEKKITAKDRKAVEEVVEQLSKPGITEIKLLVVKDYTILGTLKKPEYDKQHKFLNPRASWMLIRKMKAAVLVKDHNISIKLDKDLPKELR